MASWKPDYYKPPQGWAGKMDSEYCETPERRTTPSDIPRILGEIMFLNMLTNFFASSHPDYEHLYNDNSKSFLSVAFFKARTVCMKTGKIIIWTPDRLFDFCGEHNMYHHLLFVPIDKRDREFVLPTFWFHKEIMEEIMGQFD
jgi:hypothetical protein